MIHVLTKLFVPFGDGVPAISKHLTNVYAEQELEKGTTLSKMETVVNRGFRGEVTENGNRGYAFCGDYRKL